MISEKALKHVAIGEYIVDIVKQQGSYVLSSPGYIKNAKVITHLQSKGVESVLIDTSKSLVVQDEIVIPPANSQAQPLILEINKAKKIFNESKALQKKIFDDAKRRLSNQGDFNYLEGIPRESDKEIASIPFPYGGSKKSSYNCN